VKSCPRVFFVRVTSQTCHSLAPGCGGLMCAVSCAHACRMAAPLATTLETEICGARRCSPSPRCDSQQTYEKNEWSLDVLAVLGSGILPTPEPTLGKVFPRVKQGQQVQARKAHEQVPAAKFELGQLVATPGALAALEQSGQQPGEFLCRRQTAPARLFCCRTNIDRQGATGKVKHADRQTAPNDCH